MYLTHIYPQLIDHLSTAWRTPADVHERAVELGVGRTVGGTRQALAKWAEAGALRKTDAGPLRYKATSRALEPTTVVRIMGQHRGGQALAQLERSDASHRVPVRPDAPLPPASVTTGNIAHDLPQDLFTATFGPNGVTISYDQFHRVVALLDMITGA